MNILQKKKRKKNTIKIRWKIKSSNSYIYCTYKFRLSGPKNICGAPKSTCHNNQLVDGGQYKTEAEVRSIIFNNMFFMVNKKLQDIKLSLAIEIFFLYKQYILV